MNKIELYHHGVKGMKWGVRRYQNKDGSLTSKGRIRYSNNFINSIQNQKVSSIQKTGSLESLAVYALSIAAYSGIKYGAYQYAIYKDRKKCDKELNDYYNNRDIKDLKSAPKLKKKESTTDISKKVNPGYPNSIGSTMNCTFCTVAMAMREKGYDVVANKSTSGFYPKDLFSKTFNSEHIRIKKKSKEEILGELSKFGSGSYGNLSIYWKMGGGHSVFWKNDNGKIRIFDGQTGEEYTSNYNSEKLFFKNIIMNQTEYDRLDNLNPTEYALGLVMKRKR